jgi:hypothetical protein
LFDTDRLFDTAAGREARDGTITDRFGTPRQVAEYSAPSAGPPPWDVYEVTPATVFAVGTVEPYGATRWNF